VEVLLGSQVVGGRSWRRSLICLPVRELNELNNGMCVALAKWLNANAFRMLAATGNYSLVQSSVFFCRNCPSSCAACCVDAWLLYMLISFSPAPTATSAPTVALYSTFEDFLACLYHTACIRLTLRARAKAWFPYHCPTIRAWISLWESSRCRLAGSRSDWATLEPTTRLHPSPTYLRWPDEEPRCGSSTCAPGLCMAAISMRSCSSLVDRVLCGGH
jgi:hypothetical protein